MAHLWGAPSLLGAGRRPLPPRRPLPGPGRCQSRRPGLAGLLAKVADAEERLSHLEAQQGADDARRSAHLCKTRSQARLFTLA